MFGAWAGCDENSCKQELKRILVGCCRHGLEDYGHASAESRHTGQARMETPGGSSCLGAHRVTLVGAVPFKSVFVCVIPPSPHDDLATVARAQVREVLT